MCMGVTAQVKYGNIISTHKNDSERYMAQGGRLLSIQRRILPRSCGVLKLVSVFLLFLELHTVCRIFNVEFTQGEVGSVCWTNSVLVMQCSLALKMDGWKEVGWMDGQCHVL